MKLDGQEQNFAKNISDMAPIDESIKAPSQRAEKELMKPKSPEVLSRKSESRVVVLQDQAPP